VTFSSGAKARAKRSELISFVFCSYTNLIQSIVQAGLKYDHILENLAHNLTKSVAKNLQPISGLICLILIIVKVQS
jgi:hypothetical protein